MENNKNAFVDKWSSVYFFIPLFEKPIVMPTAEEFCSKLSEKFGRVTELSEEQKMPEDPAGLKSFGKMPLFHDGKQYAGGRSACHGAIQHSGFLC